MQGVQTPPHPPTPVKNHKNIVFLSNTGPDPLTNHKAIKPALNVGPLSDLYEGQSKIIKVDSYFLRRLTYTSEIWHMHAMNCPAPEYAIYKTMQSKDCCCLATEEC